VTGAKDVKQVHDTKVVDTVRITSEKEGGTNPNKAKIDFSQEKIIMQKLKAGMHERVKGHVATWAD
jgi:hypothetical protein